MLLTIKDKVEMYNIDNPDIGMIVSLDNLELYIYDGMDWLNYTTAIFNMDKDDFFRQELRLKKMKRILDNE